jgi:hypothetical protein
LNKDTPRLHKELVDNLNFLLNLGELCSYIEDIFPQQEEKQQIRLEFNCLLVEDVLLKSSTDGQAI